MIDLLRLCRLYYVLPIATILPLTIAYALGAEMESHRRGAGLATAALALVMAGGFALNDACDRGVDLVNAPHRPVAAGRVRPVVAANWAVLLFVTGLAVAGACRPKFLIVLAAVTALLIFYDLRSKWLGLAKPIIVAVLVTSIYPLAWAQAGSAPGRRAATLFIFPIWIFLTSFGYEMLKDIRDIAGDAAGGARPTWIGQNPTGALTAARVALAAGALALIGPALVGCGWVYAAIIPVAVALGVACVILSRPMAMAAVYAECVVVGIAALADVIVLGP